MGFTNTTVNVPGLITDGALMFTIEAGEQYTATLSKVMMW